MRMKFYLGRSSISGYGTLCTRNPGSKTADGTPSPLRWEAHSGSEPALARDSSLELEVNYSNGLSQVSFWVWHVVDGDTEAALADSFKDESLHASVRQTDRATQQAAVQRQLVHVALHAPDLYLLFR